MVIVSCGKGLRMAKAQDTVLIIRTLADLEKAKPLIQRSVEEN